MRKVKTFFEVFQNSLFPTPRYYQKILHFPFIFSLKYFFYLIILLNIIFLLTLGLQFNPKKIFTLMNSLRHSLEYYPDDLVITFKNGAAIGNYNRPYFLWLNYENKKRVLFVFDETAESHKIKTYNSILLLTSRELVLNSNLLKKSQKNLIIPLSSFSDKKISKQEISQIAIAIKKLTRYFLLFYLSLSVFVIVTTLLLSFLISLFYLILASFIALGTYRLIFKKRVHFKKTFQIGLHAATFPLVLDYLIITLKPAINLGVFFPFVEVFLPISFLILLSIFTLAGVYHSHIPAHKKITAGK